MDGAATGIGLSGHGAIDMITPDNLVPALLAHAAQRGFRRRYAGGDPRIWRDGVLADLRALILPDLPAVDFAPHWLVQEDRGDHTISHLQLTLAPGLVAPALLARPKRQGLCPAVLALHDHGSEFAIGKEKCLTPPGAPSDAASDALSVLARGWWDRFFAGEAFGDGLLRRGFAVLAVDALGWGGRQGNGYAAQQALAANLMQIGLTPAGLMAWEDLRAAEFLARLPGIDPGRIAAVGFSMGAFRAWQLAALSPHIRACVASCWMASLPGLLLPGNNHLRGQSSWWMTHPLVYRDLDLPDIAALAAPKPLYVQCGGADPLFPPAAVDAAFDILSRVWAAHHASEQLVLERCEGGHHFDRARQARAFDWLQGHVS